MEPTKNEPHQEYFQRYLGRAAFGFKAALENAFREAGWEMTSPQWLLLHALKQEEGVPQKDLARRTLKDKTNIARILAYLEEMDLIVRRKDQDDQRCYRVFLTPAGRRAESALTTAAGKTLKQALEGIPREQLQETVNTLRQMHLNLINL